MSKTQSFLAEWQLQYHVGEYNAPSCARLRVRCQSLRVRFPAACSEIWQIVAERIPRSLLLAVGERHLLDLKTLYGKIDFIYRQCLAFAAAREQRLLAGIKIPRLYLGVDRQDYIVNWTRHADRRNVMLHAVGSADINTGYVFGMHLNYDATVDSEVIEADALVAGDCQTKPPFRRYERCWLKEDYE